MRTRLVEEEIAWLHIAVDQPASMGVRQACGCLLADRRGLLMRQANPCIEEVFERATGQELGDQERDALFLAPVEHAEHIGVIERGHRPSLGPKALQERGILGQRWLEQLDRHLPLERGVLRQEHIGGRTRTKEGL
jgi:hypothetical protein